MVFGGGVVGGGLVPMVARPVRLVPRTSARYKHEFCVFLQALNKFVTRFSNSGGE